MSLITLWHRYKFRMIGAGLGILFHLSAIGLMFMSEGIVFLILVFVDFPITLLLFPLDWLGIQLWKEVVILFYFIGGTLMYAMLGWFMGPFLERQALLYGFTSRGPNNG